MKKINFLEVLLLTFLMLSLTFSICGKNRRSIELHFKVDMNAQLPDIKDKASIGIRGNIAPLNWEKTYLLTDENQDGIYEGIVTFNNSKEKLAFKFVYEDVVWELPTEGNREIDLSKKSILLPLYQWNELQPLTKSEITALTISSDQLLADFELVKTAYLTMHPGLYRYNTPDQIETHLEQLKTDLSKDLTIPETYITFSKFIAKIKCGHTNANFWNQPLIVKRAITFQKDKVPFHFKLIDRRMILTESAFNNPALSKGTEVLGINGHSIAEILETLIPLQSTDGANEGQQIVSLQLHGGDKFEAFDMYFPILFPPTNGTYQLELQDLKTQTRSMLNVPAMSRKERIALIKKQFPGVIPSMEKDYWQFKELNNETALLTLHTFSIWKWELDWKAYIKDVFDTLKEKNIQNLIIDIRHNGGGADMVSLEIFKHIATKPITVPARKVLYRFNQFPSTVKSYISSWDDSFEKRDIKKLKPLENDFYSMNGEISKIQSYKPYKNVFKGQVYLLVSPTNSSATYYMAGTAKRQQLATLVGQETGGNLKGINGGLIYFLNLPNSKIELDIPIGGVFPLTEQADKGHSPDIFVQKKVTDVMEGIDAELAATLKLIAKKK